MSVYIFLLKVPGAHLPARYIKVLSYAASVCLALALGYYLGVQFGTKTASPVVVPPETKPELKPEPKDNDDEDEELADGDLSSIKPRLMEPCKLVSACHRSDERPPLMSMDQVLVVRTDLKMTQGKIAAQYVTLSHEPMSL